MLQISEAALVCPQGPEWTYMPGIYTEEQARGWKKVTDAVHARGGLIFCQLHHVGRVAHPGTRVQREMGLPVPGPSAIAARGGKFRNVPGAPGYVVPTPIEDPEMIISHYDNASRLAKEAGFDGVELHNANGYLPHTFLESHSNHRTDKWGGSVENRMRFSLACLAQANKHFPYDRIGVKLSPCGGINDMGELDADGNPSEEAAKATYVPFCAKLDTLGLAYVEFMRYWPGMDIPVDGKPRGVNWDCIGHLRAVLKNTPVFASANFTPEEAEEWIRQTRVDAVVIGRPLLYNPDYAEKVQAGRTDELYQEQPGDEYWW